MKLDKFYIDGQWVTPTAQRSLPVINPATEEVFAEIAIGGPADVENAVHAAQRAFPDFAATKVAERRALLERILSEYDRRTDDLARAISLEMGAPAGFARAQQALMGTLHLRQMLKTLET
jgi:aldehyde dehydrogenase (NAD+)